MDWTKENQKNQKDGSGNSIQGDIIFVDKGSTLQIKNLNTLQFQEELDDTTAKHSVDAALKAFEGANVSISKVGTINLGTKDKVLKADQGFHAYGGTVNVNTDNLYGNVRGSGFLMAQSVNGGHEGILNINVTNDVDLTSVYRGLMTTGIFQGTPSSTAQNKLTAGGTIRLHVTGEEETNPENYAVIGVIDKYNGNNGQSYYGEGHGKVEISGAKGVEIISDQGTGISVNFKNQDQTSASKSSGTVAVTSNNGDVSIQAKKQAIKTNDKNISHAEIAVSGANVNLVSEEAPTIELNQNGALQLNTTQDQGKIYISSGNGVAAKVSGANSQLTIGDGTHATTVEVAGQIQVGKDGAVAISDNTTTVVDRAALGDKPFVSVADGGMFTAADNAKLQVKGAETGTDLYTKENAITFWKAANVSFDNPFQYLSDDGTVKAGITASNQNSLAGYLAPLVGITATGANDKTLQPLLLDVDSWNGAVGIGQAGGIQHSTYAVTGLFTDALADHDNTKAKDLWAKGFHSKENIDGLSFAGGGLSLDTQYNGTVVGMDVYQNEHTTAGVALTYADGNISSSNGGVYTKNDATYVGASLYGLKDLGSYRLVADLSYVGGSHDITQYNNGQVITAKPDTEAWTLGVKAMKDYTVGQGLLTPYVGLRYLRLTTDKYTSSAGLSYDKETQDLCLLPVGVDYSLQVHSGSWILKPYAGLSYIWTMGDRNANQTVTYGIATDGFAYDISDAGSFLGKLGLSASKGDYSFGVGYTYQNGSTTDSHTWTVQASYAF